MFCQKCGNQADDNNRFCNYCGAELQIPVQPGQIKDIPSQTGSSPSIKPTAGISKNMNIFFWVAWSVLLLFEIIMLSAEFTWPRCLLFLGIQVMLVFLRPRFFHKVLPASLAWLAAIVLVGVVIGFTGSDPEEMAFKQYEDYQQVDEQALQSLDSFAAAAEKGDVKTAVSCIEEEHRQQYESMFAKDPAKLQVLAEALQDAEMSMLSSPETGAEGWPRFAEYAVDYDGNTFHILMVQKEGRWMIWRM